MAQRGRLVVISGPSGVGKNTVLASVFARCSLPLTSSISATTRPPRPGEEDGVDYHFLKHEEFCARKRQGEFLECFEVFGSGTWYGTLREEVLPRLEKGEWVVLNIDVQGAADVLRQFPDAVTIFLRPASLEVLEERLRRRKTESEEGLQCRLEQAKKELSAADRYRYQVVNDDVDQAAQEICDILTQTSQRGEESA